jgi:steroid delta-isomerase-like uncharacterized protein
VSESHKAVIRRLFDDVLNGGKLGLLDSIVGAAYVDHSPASGQAAGAAGVKAKVAALREGFPDLRFTLEEIVGEDEIVAARYHWRGTHRGSFLGIPPTGKTILVRGMDFYRLRDEKIVEHWDVVDDLGMLTQLGDLEGG